jgi:osmotically-inducible protein OsmY
VAVGFAPRQAAPSSLQADLTQALARSSALADSRGIQVALVDSVVVLRGKVANEHDRRLAEGLVRMSPGVHAVRNELQVPASLAQRD